MACELDACRSHKSDPAWPKLILPNIPIVSKSCGVLDVLLCLTCVSFPNFSLGEMSVASSSPDLASMVLIVLLLLPYRSSD